MKIINSECPKCGAPIKPDTSVCPYCGTQFIIPFSNGTSKPLNAYAMLISPELGRVKCYIKEIKVHDVTAGGITDIHGKLVRNKTRCIREITVVEVGE